MSDRDDLEQGFFLRNRDILSIEQAESTIKFLKGLGKYRPEEDEARFTLQYRYKSPGRKFLLRHGHFFRTPDLKQAVQNSGQTRGPLNYCYRISLQACCRDPNLLYVEGVTICSDEQITQHAWNVQKGSSTVIDLTWEFPENHVVQYFGIAFSVEDYLGKILSRGGRYDSLFANWKMYSKEDKEVIASYIIGP